MWLECYCYFQWESSGEIEFLVQLTFSREATFHLNGKVSHIHRKKLSEVGLVKHIMFGHSSMDKKLNFLNLSNIFKTQHVPLMVARNSMESRRVAYWKRKCPMLAHINYS